MKKEFESDTPKCGFSWEADSDTQSRGSYSLFYEGGGMPRNSITTIESNIIEYFMILKTPSMLKDIF